MFLCLDPPPAQAVTVTGTVIIPAVTGQSQAAITAGWSVPIPLPFPPPPNARATAGKQQQ